MADQRSVRERTDALELALALVSLERHGRVQFSDVHDRLGTVYSDRRTGVERHVARFDAALDREFYPVGNEENTVTVVERLVADAVTAGPTIDTVAGQQIEVYGLNMSGNGAFAANRTAGARIVGPVGTVVLWIDDGAASILGTEDLPIWPVDVSTYMTGAVDPVGMPPAIFGDGNYLEWNTAGIVGAEELYLDVLYRSRTLGGLRE
jgi:hypothetical protein